MQDAGCRVQGAGCRVQSAGCRVECSGLHGIGALLGIALFLRVVHQPVLHRISYVRPETETLERETCITSNMAAVWSGELRVER